MSVKRVLQYGEKTLREPSKEVHKVSKKIQDLVQDLLDTMYAKNGVGMAAPQLGVNYRVFVVDVSKNDEPLNPIVFINPKIIKKSGAIVAQEGCISFPEAYTDVKRYKNIMVRRWTVMEDLLFWKLKTVACLQEQFSMKMIT